MTTASLKAIYDTENVNRFGGGSLSLDGGDVKLRLSMKEPPTLATGGLFLNDLTISLEKPNSFTIDYDVARKDVRFGFIHEARVLNKQLKLSYSHSRGENRTALDGTLVLGYANKLSGNYAFHTGKAKIKYSYLYKERTTLEPCYDIGINAWELAISQRIDDSDVIRASYHTSTRVLGLDYLKNSFHDGSFKVSVSLDLAKELKVPKVDLESTWNFDMFNSSANIQKKEEMKSCASIKNKKEMKTGIVEPKSVAPMQRRSFDCGAISRSVHLWLQRFQSLPKMLSGQK